MLGRTKGSEDKGVEILEQWKEIGVQVCGQQSMAEKFNSAVGKGEAPGSAIDEELEGFSLDI